MLTVKLIIAVATIAFGVWATLAPRRVLRLVGLAAEGARGITETRVALGAIYLGAGGACLWLQEPAAFATLGLAYLVMAIVRLAAIVTDRSADPSNWASLILEAGLGVLLLT